MPELISEAIEPVPGTLDPSRMGRGEPGLPGAFTWRGTRYAVVRCLESWKLSRADGGGGERYLRRHYYRLRMADGAVWTIYFVRTQRGRKPPKQRWFLYTIAGEDSIGIDRDGPR